jgi:hypothetical protein
MSVDANDSVFVYEIVVPETTAKLILTKQQVVEKLENSVGRTLSEEERTKVWNTIKSTDDWYSTFPRYAETCGLRYYGVSDYELYMSCFEADVNLAIQESIHHAFSVVWENLFERALCDIVDTLEPVITWDTVESFTKEQIQNENVRNGVARCAKELKETSIKKWKKQYINSHIVTDGNLPNGKTKEDLINHVYSFLS